MKRMKYLRIGLFLPLLFLLVLTLTASAWLPIGGLNPEAIVSGVQAASTGSKQDIVRVDIAYKTAAASATKVGGYKLTGVKWLTRNLPVQYAFNPDGNNSVLGDSTVKGILAVSAETWDAKTGVELFAQISQNYTDKLYGDLDGTNTIGFGYLGSGGTIAVTSYWYNRKTRDIVEFDMCFNNYYKWGNADLTDVNVMDIQNIATHEFGHAVGLSDIYLGAYSYVTMYGYSDYNDIIKRDLAAPDIAGLQKIYGP